MKPVYSHNSSRQLKIIDGWSQPLSSVKYNHPSVMALSHIFPGRLHFNRWNFNRRNIYHVHVFLSRAFLTLKCVNHISNHQTCLLSRLFTRRSKKISKLHGTGLCAGNSPGTGEFPAQMASNAENVSIWWRHHDLSWNANELINILSRTWCNETTIQDWSVPAFPTTCAISVCGHDREWWYECISYYLK